MTEYHWIMVVIGIATLAIAFAGYTVRKQTALSNSFDKLYKKIDANEKDHRAEITRLENWIVKTREEMMANYVQHASLEKHMSELEKRLALELRGAAADIKTSMADALQTHAQEEYRRTRELVRQVLQDVTGVKVDG